VRPVLVIMTKEPVAGRVKTRLARDVGTAQAAAIFRHMQASVIARLAYCPRWQTVLAVAPDLAVTSRMLPRRIARVRQGGGDIGARMQRIFDETKPGPVVIVGTDIPGITPADITAAFRALRDHDAVFAPARDGGYWLVGLKRFPRTPAPFSSVRWSSPAALSDTLANLSATRCAILRAVDDLDTADELAKLRPFIGRRILPRASVP
jgi:rSAM/selenodomain-associated transferase 1